VKRTRGVIRVIGVGRIGLVCFVFRFANILVALATCWAFLLIETLLAEFAAARLAGGKTTVAERFIAATAGAGVGRAEMLEAVVAGRGALAADFVSAPLAAVAIIVTYETAAAGTVSAVPVCQLHVGGVRAVRFQDLTHQDEEVQEPPLLDRVSDR